MSERDELQQQADQIRASGLLGKPGVTALRDSEPLEAALERADEALYEAKRTGKNRTCIG